MMGELPRLPKGWTWTRIRDVGEIRLGRQRSPKNHQGPHMRPYLRVANVFEDRIDLSDVMEMNFTPKEYETYALQHGDVLLNEGQSPHLVGRPAMYRGELPGGCFTNSLVRFRAHPGVEPRYALIIFRAQLHLQRYMKIAKITTNIAHLGAGRFAEVEFPLAPLNEQRRIVAAIERHFSRLDVAVATLERVKAKLALARASVLKAAVEGRLVPTEAALAQAEGRDYEPASVLLERILAERRARWERAELAKLIRAGRPPMGDTWKRRYKAGQPTSEAGNLPDGWVWTTLDQLAHYNVDYRGKTPPTSGSGVPIISAANVKGGKIVLGGKTRFVTQEVYDRWTVRGLPEPGDLIVTTEAPVGETALYPSTGTYLLTRRVIGFQTSEVAPSFLGYAFHGAAGKKHLKKHNRGTTVPRILKPALMQIPVPLPPLTEQHRIVAEVDRQLSVLDEVSRLVDANLARCARLRQAILKRAFEGRLVPQDPTDEPASVLLERIKAEAAKSPRKKNNRRRRSRRGTA